MGAQTNQKRMTQNMILGQLITNEVTDERVLQAITDTPRLAFVPEHLHGVACVDEDIEIGHGRFLMEPMIFAKLLMLAEVTPACRVLNIGVLTGYSAVVLSKLATHVTATECETDFVEMMRAHIKTLAIDNIDVQQLSNLAQGYPPSAPYDVIFINGAVQSVSEKLSHQLSTHGRLVAVHSVATRPGIGMGLGKGIVAKRIHGQLQVREFFDASAVILPGFESESCFSF